MAKLSVGDAFPDITLQTREGDMSLAERWRDGPLVVAFMRHFG
jgi:peroxiredoxin